MNTEQKLEQAAEGYKRKLKNYSSVDPRIFESLSACCEASFVDGAKSEAARDYWFEQFSKVTRLEVVNHKSVDGQHDVGRILVHTNVKSCELELQDDDRTLKIFI